MKFKIILIMGLLMGAAQVGANYLLGQKNRRDSMEDYRTKANLNYDLEMKKWNATNYGAQVKHMKDAGLSISQMYGGTGTSGQTSSTTQGGGEQVAFNNPIDLAQLQLIKSQSELAKANAEKAKADAEKTRGVDTDKAKAEIDVLETTVPKMLEETKGIGLQNEGQRLANDINAVEYRIKRATEQNAIDIVKYEADNLHYLSGKLIADTRKANAESAQIEKTTDLIVDTYKAGLENIAKDLLLKDSQIGVNKANVSKILGEVDKMINDVFRDNQQLLINAQNANTLAKDVRMKMDIAKLNAEVSKYVVNTQAETTMEAVEYQRGTATRTATIFAVGNLGKAVLDAMISRYMPFKGVEVKPFGK